VTTQVISALLTFMAMSMAIGVIVVLGYTTFVLHKVHAGHVRLATPGGHGREGSPAAEQPRHPGPVPAGPQAEARPAPRPRRKWATRLRVATVLAATLGAARATGWNHHWPALALDAAVLLLTAWLIRR
jgi:hypothetical protein